MDIKHIKCNFAGSVTEDKTSREECASPKNRVIHLLDEVERHVDILRRDLLLLEEKKDTLLTTLDSIRHSDLVAQLSSGRPLVDSGSHNCKGRCRLVFMLGDYSLILSEEKSDVGEHADRLVKMCSAIDIKVTTHRDQRQEEALCEVNRLIDSLVLVFRSDPQSARDRCLSYVSACTDRGVSCKAVEVGVEEEEEEEASTSPRQQFIPDAVFEEAMFLCTLDDRKRVQRRLHGLLSYIEREMVPLFPPTL